MGDLRGHPELDLQILQCLAPAAAAAGCLDAVNARGRTALAEVVDAGYSYRRPCLASVRVLLAAGADPNAAGETANRPLRVAVRGCGKDDNPQGAEIVAALLDAGADPKAAPGQYVGSPMHAALSSAQVELVVMLLEAGACSTGEALADVIQHICILMARGMDSGSSGLRNLQLLLSTQHPKHAKLTAAQVQEVLPFALGRVGREGCYPAAVLLLRYLQRAGGSAVEALSGARVNDPAALRVALLQGWAAATAEGDEERAAVAADEQGAAAASSGFREMLLGVAELEV